WLGIVGLGFALCRFGPAPFSNFFKATAAGLKPMSLWAPERVVVPLNAAPNNGEQSRLAAWLRSGRYRELEAELRVAGAKDPWPWLEWAGAISGEERKPAVYAVLSGWYRSHPREMLKWAEAHGREYFSSGEFKQAAIAAGNIAFAVRGLNLIADPAAKAAQIEAVFAGFGAQDSSQALEAAEALDPVSRQAALLGVLPVLAGEFPDIALEAADACSNDPTERYGLLKAMVNRWMTQKGMAPAQAYFLQQPVSANLDGGYAALAEASAATNPGESGCWLNKISNPVQREEATVAVIGELTPSNPEIASRLVADLMTIAPEKVTLARLENTVRSWAAKDPPAAFSYVYSLNALSSPGRRALLQKLALVGPP
ncbi:MAG: hypothetical protein ABSE59_06225, partial [Opitutaceae bacterium]